MSNNFFRRTIAIGGLGLFAGLSILNMQTYLALAKEAYALVKYLPFAWWLSPQLIPAALMAMAVSAFFLVRGKKVNPFFVALGGISAFLLFILAMMTQDMAVSSFGLLLWATSTALQTAPFWCKTTFFVSIRSAFRNHKPEEAGSGESDGIKTLVEQRNALPEQILQGFTVFALAANAVDILLGIWQYPPISFANFVAFNFSAETIDVSAVIKIILLSVLPEVLLVMLSRVLYLSSLTQREGTKAAKRSQFPQAQQQRPVANPGRSPQSETYQRQRNGRRNRNPQF